MLLARIRAQLRQYEASEDAVFQIGPYTFRPGAKLLINEKGSKLKLTEKETAILRYLYRAGQKVVGRDVLLAEVWGYNANVTTHTLETHIYRLRQKIETDPSNARILVTEPGGYKLIALRPAHGSRGRHRDAVPRAAVQPSGPRCAAPRRLRRRTPAAAAGDMLFRKGDTLRRRLRRDAAARSRSSRRRGTRPSSPARAR